MEATDSPFAVEVHDLCKRFGKVQAIHHLSFEIPCGVIAGFVGPNGSGKTTTMRVLATLLRQDGGVARVFGHDTRSPAAVRQVRHAIGFMPDYFGLYTDMTAGEYLEFFCAAYRIPTDRRPTLVDDILALVGLTGKKDELIAGLSRGMQQKLSLGRALVHSPRLLLLDEPASGLDPRARIELMELLRELKRMGKTIFISSHILSELHTLCDMVVIVEKGHGVYTGSLADASASISEGHRYLELAIDGDLDSAAEIVKAVAGVRALHRKGTLLIVEHDPDTASAAILEGCIRGGVRVAEARRESANLEAIFMRLTGADE